MLILIAKYRKQKRSSAIIYDRGELLPPEGEIQAQLFSYTCSVLDALGIMNGPAHAEVMMTESGPVLVEIGARLDGANTPALHRVAAGTDQVELTLDAYLDPKTFFKKATKPVPNLRNVLRVSLISDQQGIVVGIPGLKMIQELPSFHEARMLTGIDLEIHPTIDMFTSPGIIDLVHESPEVLERDYERIRHLERARGLFAVRPKIVPS